MSRFKLFNKIRRTAENEQTRETKSDGFNRRTYLKGLAGVGVAYPVFTTVGSSPSTAQEMGGPVILMGLDSELGAGGDGHGPVSEHQDMVQSLLDSVTNDGEGILVLGGSEDDATYVQPYWEVDIGGGLGVDITFAKTATDIEAAEFDGYAAIGVASSEFQVAGEGLTNDANEALVDRRDDIAEFVNSGGGLLGKTQEGLDNAWEYVDPFGEFENNENANYSLVEVTQAGLDLGLTQEGMSGWCCYHETFTEFPDFFDVLIINDDSGDPGYREAAAIGGVEVVIPRDCIDRPERGRGDMDIPECTDRNKSSPHIDSAQPQRRRTGRRGERDVGDRRTSR